MKITKKVQFLSKNVSENGLREYAFLDLETNFPFSVYSLKDYEIFDKFQPYSVHDVDFNLVLSKNQKSSTFLWKMKTL